MAGKYVKATIIFVFGKFSAGNISTQEFHV
jgi:hypothetical protein